MVALEERLVELGDDRKAQVAQAHRKELADVGDLAHLQLAVELERTRVGLESARVRDADAAVAREQP